VVQSRAHDLFSLPLVHMDGVANRNEEGHHGWDVALVECIPKFLEALERHEIQLVMRRRTRREEEGGEGGGGRGMHAVFYAVFNAVFADMAKV
jgi:hypothetical protein